MCIVCMFDTDSCQSNVVDIRLEWRTRTRGVYQNSRVCQFDLLKPDFLAETSHNKRGYLSQYPCKISPSNSLSKCGEADPRVLVRHSSVVTV